MILVVDNGSKYVRNLVDIIKKFNISYDFIYDKNNDDKYSGAILSGGPHLLSEGRFVDNDYNSYLLDNFKKPILGICLGHQLICLHYGGSIKKVNEVKGEEKIIVMNNNRIFYGLNKELVVAENHCENIIRLPESLELLAFSDSCGVEAVKHKDKDVYGVQFHPEISGSIGESIINNFLDICYGKL